MDLGLHLTLTDTESILDPEILALASSINPTLSKEFGRVWDLFGQRGTALTTDEFEVLQRQYTQPEVVVQSTTGVKWDTDSATTDMPVSAGTIDRLTIGDILLVENEIVVVKTVDRSGNTVDVYERGAGESTAVAHGTSAITALIIGNAHVEGRVDSEAMAESTDKRTNYTQLVEEKVDLSYANTQQARKIGRTEEVLKREVMERVMRDLARTAIHGVAVAPTSSKPSMTRGLRQWLKLSGGLVTNVSGAFTETVLQNMIDNVRTAGGSVNAIVMGIAKKKILNGFSGADVVNTDRTDRTAGRVIDSYLADGLGVLPVVVDLDFPSDEVAVVDSRKLSKGWKVGDELRFETEPSNSRQMLQTLQGRFGLAVENVGNSHAIAVNLT